MEDLMDKKLLFFCGKGGAGKTASSLATALYASKKNKKVLLFSLTSMEYIESCFKTKVKEDPTKLAENLYCVELNMQKGVESLIASHLKSKKVAKALMNNTIFQSIVEAMSGFKEMLALQKVIEYKDDYSLLIIDAPATGHSMTLLNAPKKIMGLVKKGEIYELASKVNDLLVDKSKTSVNIVTILEEMAVNETCELSSMVKGCGMGLDYIIINQIEALMNNSLANELLKKSLFSEDVTKVLSSKYPLSFFSQVIECNSAMAKRQEEGKRYLNILTAKVKANFKEVPIVYTANNLDLLSIIGGYMFNGV